VGIKKKGEIKMKIKEAINILRDHGYDIPNNKGEAGYYYIKNLEYGSEEWSYYKVINTAIKLKNKRVVIPDLEYFKKIIKKMYPNAKIEEAAYSLFNNYMFNGLMSKKTSISKDDVYAVLIADLRHNNTDYEKGRMGDDNRSLFNESLHEKVKEILGI
jgi:hypothetical protein